MRVAKLHEASHDVEKVGPRLFQLYGPQSLLPYKGPDDVSEDGAQHVQLPSLHPLLITTLSRLLQCQPDPLRVGRVLLNLLRK